MILLLTLLLTKHFYVDFVFQPRWMWANKGTWMHPGGLAHAGLHGATTLVILLWFLPPAMSLFVALAEVVAHYLIDWAKMNYNARYGWKADNSEYFWWLLGFDQWLHGMCYVAIIWFTWDYYTLGVATVTLVPQ